MKSSQLRRALCVLAFLLAGTAPCFAACTVQLSDANIDYGYLTRGELLSQQENALTSTELQIGEEKTLDLLINCEHAGPLSLQFIAPARDSESYLFGRQGKAVLRVHTAYVDNQAVDIARDMSGVDSGQKAILSAGRQLTFWRDNVRISGTQLRAKVSVITFLPTDQTRVKESQSWQLQGYFQVNNSE